MDEEQRLVRLQDISKPVDEVKEHEFSKDAAGISDSDAVGGPQWSTEIEEKLGSIMSTRILKDLEELVTKGSNFDPGSKASQDKLDAIAGPGIESTALDSNEKGSQNGELATLSYICNTNLTVCY